MENIPRKKYPFWSKKGKPSGSESEVLKKIKDIAQQHNISEDAIVQKYGLANDINSLQQMFGFIEKDIEKQETPTEQQSEPTEPIEKTQQPGTMQDQDELQETHEESTVPPDPDHYGASTRHRSYAGGTNSNSDTPRSTINAYGDSGQSGQAGPDSTHTDTTSKEESDIPETGTSDIGDKEVDEDQVKFGAESYVQGYNEIVLGLGKLFTQFSVRKLKKLHRNKQIDLEEILEKEDGSEQTIKDCCEEHNEDVDKTLVPDPDKDARITKALIRVMQKHNHEPSPEQILVQEVLYDLKEKTQAIVELAATKNDMLNFFIESHAEKMEALKNSNNNNNSGSDGNSSKKGEDAGITPTEEVN